MKFCGIMVSVFCRNQIDLKVCPLKFVKQLRLFCIVSERWAIVFILTCSIDVHAQIIFLMTAFESLPNFSSSLLLVEVCFPENFVTEVLFVQTAF